MHKIKFHSVQMYAERQLLKPKLTLILRMIVFEFCVSWQDTVYGTTYIHDETPEQKHAKQIAWALQRFKLILFPAFNHSIAVVLPLYRTHVLLQL